jgi:hypothetical protein
MRSPDKAIKWTRHAEAALIERKIERSDVVMTLWDYEFRVPDRLPPNEVLMRRYIDPSLGRPALLRVVILETELEIVIVTVYKTTRMNRYLKDLVP